MTGMENYSLRQVGIVEKRVIVDQIQAHEEQPNNSNYAVPIIQYNYFLSNI